MKYVCSSLRDRRDIALPHSQCRAPGLHLTQLMNCSHFKETRLLFRCFSDASLQMQKAGLCLDFCRGISFLLLCWCKVKIFSLSSLPSTKICRPDLNLNRYLTEIVNLLTDNGVFWPKRLLNKTCPSWQQFSNKNTVDDDIPRFCNNPLYNLLELDQKGRKRTQNGRHLLFPQVPNP